MANEEILRGDETTIEGTSRFKRRFIEISRAGNRIVNVDQSFQNDWNNHVRAALRSNAHDLLLRKLHTTESIRIEDSGKNVESDVDEENRLMSETDIEVQLALSRSISYQNGSQGLIRMKIPRSSYSAKAELYVQSEAELSIEVSRLIEEREAHLLSLKIEAKELQQKYLENYSIDEKNMMDSMVDLFGFMRAVRLSTVLLAEALAAWSRAVHNGTKKFRAKKQQQRKFDNSEDPRQNRKFCVMIAQRSPGAFLYPASEALTSSTKRFSRNREQPKLAIQTIFVGLFTTKDEAVDAFIHAFKSIPQENILLEDKKSDGSEGNMFIGLRTCGNHYLVRSSGVPKDLPCEQCIAQELDQPKDAVPNVFKESLAQFIWKGQNYLEKMWTDLDFLEEVSLLKKAFSKEDFKGNPLLLSNDIIVTLLNRLEKYDNVDINGNLCNRNLERYKSRTELLCDALKQGDRQNVLMRRQESEHTLRNNPYMLDSLALLSSKSHSKIMPMKSAKGSGNQLENILISRTSISQSLELSSDGFAKRDTFEGNISSSTIGAGRKISNSFHQQTILAHNLNNRDGQRGELWKLCFGDILYPNGTFEFAGTKQKVFSDLEDNSPVQLEGGKHADLDVTESDITIEQLELALHIIGQVVKHKMDKFLGQASQKNTNILNKPRSTTRHGGKTKSKLLSPTNFGNIQLLAIEPSIESNSSTNRVEAFYGFRGAQFSIQQSRKPVAYRTDDIFCRTDVGEWAGLKKGRSMRAFEFQEALYTKGKQKEEDRKKIQQLLRSAVSVNRVNCNPEYILSLLKKAKSIRGSILNLDIIQAENFVEHYYHLCKVALFTQAHFHGNKARKVAAFLRNQKQTSSMRKLLVEKEAAMYSRVFVSKILKDATERFIKLHSRPFFKTTVNLSGEFSLAMFYRLGCKLRKSSELCISCRTQSHICLYQPKDRQNEIQRAPCTCLMIQSQERILMRIYNPMNPQKNLETIIKMDSFREILIGVENAQILMSQDYISKSLIGTSFGALGPLFDVDNATPMYGKGYSYSRAVLLAAAESSVLPLLPKFLPEQVHTAIRNSPKFLQNLRPWLRSLQRPLSVENFDNIDADYKFSCKINAVWDWPVFREIETAERYLERAKQESAFLRSKINEAEENLRMAEKHQRQLAVALDRLGIEYEDQLARVLQVSDEVLRSVKKIKETMDFSKLLFNRSTAEEQCRLENWSQSYEDFEDGHGWRGMNQNRKLVKQHMDKLKKLWQLYKPLCDTEIAYFQSIDASVCKRVELANCIDAYRLQLPQIDIIQSIYTNISTNVKSALRAVAGTFTMPRKMPPPDCRRLQKTPLNVVFVRDPLDRLQKEYRSALSVLTRRILVLRPVQQTLDARIKSVVRCVVLVLTDPVTGNFVVHVGQDHLPVEESFQHTYLGLQKSDFSDIGARPGILQNDIILRPNDLRTVMTLPLDFNLRISSDAYKVGAVKARQRLFWEEKPFVLPTQQPRSLKSGRTFYASLFKYRHLAPTYRKRHQQSEAKDLSTANALLERLRLQPHTGSPCLGLLHFLRRIEYTKSQLEKCLWFSDLLNANHAGCSNEVAKEFVRVADSMVYSTLLSNLRQLEFCFDHLYLDSLYTTSIAISTNEIVNSFIYHQTPVSLAAFLYEMICNSISQDTRSLILRGVDMISVGSGVTKYWRHPFLGEMPLLKYHESVDARFRGPIYSCHRFVSGLYFLIRTFSTMNGDLRFDLNTPIDGRFWKQQYRGSRAIKLYIQRDEIRALVARVAVSDILAGSSDFKNIKLLHPDRVDVLLNLLLDLVHVKRDLLVTCFSKAVDATQLDSNSEQIFTSAVVDVDVGFENISLKVNLNNLSARIVTCIQKYNRWIQSRGITSLSCVSERNIEAIKDALVPTFNLEGGESLPDYQFKIFKDVTNKSLVDVYSGVWMTPNLEKYYGDAKSFLTKTICRELMKKCQQGLSGVRIKELMGNYGGQYDFGEEVRKSMFTVNVQIDVLKTHVTLEVHEINFELDDSQAIISNCETECMENEDKLSQNMREVETRMKLERLMQLKLRKFRYHIDNILRPKALKTQSQATKWKNVVEKMKNSFFTLIDVCYERHSFLLLSELMLLLSNGSVSGLQDCLDDNSSGFLSISFTNKERNENFTDSLFTSEKLQQLGDVGNSAAFGEELLELKIPILSGNCPKQILQLLHWMNSYLIQLQLAFKATRLVNDLDNLLVYRRRRNRWYSGVLSVERSIKYTVLAGSFRQLEVWSRSRFHSPIKSDLGMLHYNTALRKFGHKNIIRLIGERNDTDDPAAGMVLLSGCDMTTLGTVGLRMRNIQDGEEFYIEAFYHAMLPNCDSIENTRTFEKKQLPLTILAERIFHRILIEAMVSVRIRLIENLLQQDIVNIGKEIDHAQQSVDEYKMNLERKVVTKSLINEVKLSRRSNKFVKNIAYKEVSPVSQPKFCGDIIYGYYIPEDQAEESRILTIKTVRWRAFCAEQLALPSNQSLQDQILKRIDNTLIGIIYHCDSQAISEWCSSLGWNDSRIKSSRKVNQRLVQLVDQYHRNYGWCREPQTIKSLRRKIDIYNYRAGGFNIYGDVVLLLRKGSSAAAEVSNFLRRMYDVYGPQRALRLLKDGNERKWRISNYKKFKSIVHDIAAPFCQGLEIIYNSSLTEIRTASTQFPILSSDKLCYFGRILISKFAKLLDADRLKYFALSKGINVIDDGNEHQTQIPLWFMNEIQLLDDDVVLTNDEILLRFDQLLPEDATAFLSNGYLKRFIEDRNYNVTVPIPPPYGASVTGFDSNGNSKPYSPLFLTLGQIGYALISQHCHNCRLPYNCCKFPLCSLVRSRSSNNTLSQSIQKLSSLTMEIDRRILLILASDRSIHFDFPLDYQYSSSDVSLLDEIIQDKGRDELALADYNKQQAMKIDWRIAKKETTFFLNIRNFLTRQEIASAITPFDFQSAQGGFEIETIRTSLTILAKEHKVVKLNCLSDQQDTLPIQCKPEKTNDKREIEPTVVKKSSSINNVRSTIIPYSLVEVMLGVNGIDGKKRFVPPWTLDPYRSENDMLRSKTYAEGTRRLMVDDGQINVVDYPMASSLYNWLMDRVLLMDLNFSFPAVDANMANVFGMNNNDSPFRFDRLHCEKVIKFKDGNLAVVQLLHGILSATLTNDDRRSTSIALMRYCPTSILGKLSDGLTVQIYDIASAVSRTKLLTAKDLCRLVEVFKLPENTLCSNLPLLCRTILEYADSCIHLVRVAGYCTSVEINTAMIDGKTNQQPNREGPRCALSTFGRKYVISRSSWVSINDESPVVENDSRHIMSRISKMKAYINN